MLLCIAIFFLASSVYRHLSRSALEQNDQDEFQEPTIVQCGLITLSSTRHAKLMKFVDGMKGR